MDMKASLVATSLTFSPLPSRISVLDPQAELSWQLPIPGEEQKVSRVSLSDLLNSENQAKFRLVKATLDTPLSFVFIGTCMEETALASFFSVFTHLR